MFRRLFHILGHLLALVTGIGLLARFIPPDVLWPPTLLALLLPALLALLLLFVLLMALRRRWRMMAFPALVLILSLSVVGRMFSFGGSRGVPSSSTEPTITVATNNLRGFRNDDNELISSGQVTAFVEKMNADILLLQEATPKVSKPHFSKVIKAAGPYKGHDQLRLRTVATFAGSLRNVDAVFEGYNGYMISDVETTLGTIRFINAHLQSNQISDLASKIGTNKDVEQELDRAESMFRRYGRAARRRAAQAEGIRRSIQQSPHPVVLAGDFNDVPSSYTYQRLLTPRLKDGWVQAGFGLGTTFTGPLPGLRIDFIMVDTSLSVVEIERFDTGFSDHLGLRAVLKK